MLPCLPPDSWKCPSEQNLGRSGLLLNVMACLLFANFLNVLSGNISDTKELFIISSRDNTTMAEGAFVHHWNYLLNSSQLQLFKSNFRQ